jgi:hypothetical protein
MKELRYDLQRTVRIAGPMPVDSNETRAESTSFLLFESGNLTKEMYAIHCCTVYLTKLHATPADAFQQQGPCRADGPVGAEHNARPGVLRRLS